MLLAIVAILFILGLIIGSFLNVVIYRFLHGTSPLQGRSMCPHCSKVISWYDNIPVLSYLILRGKCRKCHSSIAWTYPVVEILTGSLFVWWYLGGFIFFRLTQHPFSIIQPTFWLLIGIFLLIIFVTDLISYIIPDYAVIAISIFALIYRLTLSVSGIMQWSDFGLSILSGLVTAVFFFSIWLGTKGKGLGFGDVKFAIPMGLLLGWPNIIVGLFISFVLGAGVGLFLISLKRKTIKQAIPFGPFLVMGTVIALVYGKSLLQWYLNML